MENVDKKQVGLWALTAAVVACVVFVISQLLGDDGDSSTAPAPGSPPAGTSSATGTPSSGSATPTSSRPPAGAPTGTHTTSPSGVTGPTSTSEPSASPGVPTVPPGAIPPGASTGPGLPSYSWSDDPDGQYKEGEPKFVAAAYVRAVNTIDYTKDPIYRSAQTAKTMSTPQWAATSLDGQITPGRPLTFQQSKERSAGARVEVQDVRTGTFQSPGMPPPPADEAVIMVNFKKVQHRDGERTELPEDETVVWLKKVGGRWLVNDVTDAY